MATPVNVPPAGGVTPVPLLGTSDADVAALASQLKSMVDAAASSGVALSQALIAATAYTATPPTVSITMSGSTVQIDGVSFMEGYTPQVGDNVNVLKAGNTVLVLGHVADTGTATQTSGGWFAPSLSSGFTTGGNSNGPVMARFVLDGGAPKMQWKGSVAHSGTNTTIVASGTLVAPMVPASKVSVITARDTGGGSTVVGLEFTTTGGVNLVGPNTFVNHVHSLGTSDTQLSGYLSQAGSDLGHAHGLGTSFSASSGAIDPTWVSFNNVQYFLT